MESDGSLLCLKDPAPDLYPKPDESNLPSTLFKINFNIFPSMLRSYEWSLLISLSNKNFSRISHLFYMCSCTNTWVGKHSSL
jgi:hypothetical protein